MSSPMQKTLGSRSISSQIPWRIASRYVSSGMPEEFTTFAKRNCHLEDRVMAQLGFLFRGVIVSEVVLQAKRRACPERLTIGKKRTGPCVDRRRCTRDP